MLIKPGLVLLLEAHGNVKLQDYRYKSVGDHVYHALSNKYIPGETRRLAWSRGKHLVGRWSESDIAYSIVYSVEMGCFGLHEITGTT